MLPRPLLTTTFAVHYRKIPILAIGREIYCDTSLIIEALEHYFPASAGWGSVYPKFNGLDEWTYRGLVKGFASFWTDVSTPTPHVCATMKQKQRRKSKQ
jgi:glutathione S-transferase